MNFQKRIAECEVGDVVKSSDAPQNWIPRMSYEMEFVHGSQDGEIRTFEPARITVDILQMDGPQYSCEGWIRVK